MGEPCALLATSSLPGCQSESNALESEFETDLCSPARPAWPIGHRIVGMALALGVLGTVAAIIDQVAHHRSLQQRITSGQFLAARPSGLSSAVGAIAFNRKEDISPAPNITAFSYPDYKRRARNISDGQPWPQVVSDGGWRFAWWRKNNPDLPVKITLSNKTAGLPSPHHFGVNLPVYIKKDIYMNAANLIKDAGFKVLRFPGGTTANRYIWTWDYDTFPFYKKWDYMTKSTNLNTDDFIELCRLTGAEALVQLNYAVFMTHGVEVGTKLAVDWLKHFRKRGFKVRYWEFGNENYANWETPTNDGFKNVTGDLYGKHLEIVSKAMKDIDPDVHIGAVVLENENSNGNGERAEKWMKGVVPHLKGHADFTIFHNYFFNPMNWSVPGGQYVLPKSREVIDADKSPVVSHLRSNVDGLLNKYSPGLKLPCAMTEWNIDIAWPHVDTTVNEHVSALITADILGQIIKRGGFDAGSYFSFSGAWADTGPESKHNPGPGDMAIIARGDNTTADNTPRPAWLAYALFERAMGDRLVESTSDTSDVVVYASTFSTGELGLIIINRKSQAVALHVENLRRLGKGFNFTSNMSEARGWFITSATPNAKDPMRARGSQWNGHSSPTKVGGIYPVDPIRPYAARFNINTPEALHIPAASLAGIVLYPAGAQRFAAPFHMVVVVGLSMTTFWSTGIFRW